MFIPQKHQLCTTDTGSIKYGDLMSFHLYTILNVPTHLRFST